MSRTTTALKRLGVAGIATVTMAGVLPALVATPASAAHVSSINLTPETATASVATCVAYTARVAPAQSTVVDVQISQTTRQQTAANTPQTIQFCAPPTTSGPNQQTPTDTTTTDAAGNVTPTGGVVCPVTTTQDPLPATTSTNVATCNAEFTTDANGAVTFGVRSDTPGTVTITSYVEAANSPATAAPNVTGNNTPNVGEQQDSSTLSTLSNANTAVTAIACTPENGFAAQGAAVNFTCTVTSNNGATPITGVNVNYIITSGPDATQTPQNCNAATNNDGRAVCNVPNASGRPGTDVVYFYVEQNNQAGPQNSEPNDQDNAVFTGAARVITTTPATATVVTGQEQRVTAMVQDLNGQPVRNTNVRFQLNGPGRVVSNCEIVNFISGQQTSDDDTCFRTTDANGEAAVTVKADVPGTLTVAADIIDPATGQPASGSNANTTECRQSAGNTTTNATGSSVANAPAGDCRDSSVLNYVSTTSSPSPSASPAATPTATTAPSATPTATTSPSGPPAPGCTVPASISLDRDTITATGSAQVTVRATPNSVVEVYAYSRPSTTYRVVRRIEVGTNGTASDRIVPPTNTRLYAQQQGCNASPSIVLNVRTALSLNVERLGARTYRFSGDSLPARPGGLIISLYRVTNDGRQVLASQVRANSTNGEWTLDRRFTGSGRFGFVVRTGQDLQNAPGSSNVRSLLVF